MTAIAVVGAQWGDEGKAAVTDRLAQQATMVVRYNGGPNAGHTVVVEGKKYVLHNLPVGVVSKSCVNVVGSYVLCDLEVVAKELALAAVKNGGQVLLDSSAPVILPIHRQLDGAREAANRSQAIGTTGRGIGPAYEDWAARRGLVLGDLKSKKVIRQALERSGYYAERQAVAAHYGVKPLSLEETVNWCSEKADRICPFLGDTRALVALAVEGGERHRILFEGAQGMMLDVLSGVRPYTTSSICGPAAIQASFGRIPLGVLGVLKPYTTYIGEGPFPTEFGDDQAAWFREKGEEYGATTGRPRRCGRLDLPALRYACRMGGIDSLVVTKLDVLSGLERIEVCAGYKGVADYVTLTREVLANAKPTYEQFPGWDANIQSCLLWRELPLSARDFLDRIEQYTGVHVVAVGVGPDRDQMIWRE